MKKNLPLLLSFLLLFSLGLKAQPSGPYIVADNGTFMASCEDTLITMDHIYTQLGIRDLNDPNDEASNYRILRLSGSLITQDEITSFKYSDYSAVFIHKRNVPFSNGNAGVQIFLRLITGPPAFLFSTDSLKFTVDREAKKNFVSEFFGQVNIWSSGLDNVLLQDRILFTDMAVGVESPMSQVPDWSNRGKGTYRFRYAVAVCSPSDLFWDTLYVKIQETLCNNIQIKNAVPVCRDEVTDITPYVYINNQLATTAEINQMTFKDRSLLNSQVPGATLDPTAINIASMYDGITRNPFMEVTYQPNVELGTCGVYSYFFTTKVPTPISVSPTVMTLNNYGSATVFDLDRTFYSVNNEFDKNTVKAMYIDNYNVFAGTELAFYTDQQLQNPVVGDNLVPGMYHVTAINPACANDVTKFTINVINRDFDIIWHAASNIGKGYYDFSAPDYPGATYSWFVWGGSIVNGLNTKDVRVYYSETASANVLVTCKITLPAARTTEEGVMNSGVYLSATGEDGEYEVMEPQIVTSVDDPATATAAAVAYPNPAESTFMVSGEGTMELSVYNALGQLVHEDKAYSPNTPINVQTKGVHIVRLNQNSKSQTIKVVLK